MDDLRSLREQRDDLRVSLDEIMERNDSIDDVESIEKLEKGAAKMAEMDKSIRSAEARAAYESAKTNSVGSYGFKSDKGAAESNYEGEYRFVMDGTKVRVEGRSAQTGGTSPSASLPGMDLPLPPGGNYSAAIPVDLQAELIRQLPAKAITRQFYQTRQYANDVELQRVATRVQSAADFATAESGKVSLTPESSSYTNVDMALERVRVNNFKTAAKSEVTEEFMKDARGRAVAELLLQHAEEHGQLWDRGYASGSSGTAGPDPCWNYSEGTNPGTSISDFMGGDADTAGSTIKSLYGTGGVSWSTELVGKLTDLRYGTIPAQYWGGLRWMTNQVTFAAITATVDAFGRPLMQPLAGSTPTDSMQAGTLLGLPVFVSNNLSGTLTGAGIPTEDDTALVLAHQEDYSIFDRSNFSQQIDPFSEGDTGKIVYRTRMRSVGRWLRPFAAGALVWKDCS